MSKTILIADDEAKIVKLAADYLEADGYRTLRAFDGKRAVELFRSLSPDLVILDIMMPVKNGIEATREIRQDSNVPIIFLTAKAEETDRIVGLELGADDYVVKPFSPRELVARVRAVLRRTAEQDNHAEVIERGDICIDVKRRRVTVAGIRKDLTAVQFRILLVLAKEPGRVFTRLELLDATQGTTSEGYERTIDAHIKNLRKALADKAASHRYVGTVRSFGYKLIEPGADG
jgi:DNA-binding response OmpR family regulator